MTAVGAHRNTDPAGHVRCLASDHRLFSRLLDRNGPPPDWRRPASFATLTRLILEQQVSLASAAAAYGRLESRVGAVTPLAILASSDAELKTDGFSRQKAGYVRDLARLVIDGTLSPGDLRRRPEDAPASLLAVRGIGPWTVSCFQLFALGHHDVWPTGDRALYVSMGRNLGMNAVPQRDEADIIAADWAPHRSAAARMLWHDYLGGRAYVPDPGAGFI